MLGGDKIHFSIGELEEISKKEYTNEADDEVVKTALDVLQVPYKRVICGLVYLTDEPEPIPLGVFAEHLANAFRRMIN